MTIKELRKKSKLTQKDAAALVGIPLRTFKMYENNDNKTSSIKYNYIIEQLEEYSRIDETHGVLTLEEIKEGVNEILSEFSVDYAILFGSYAKNIANEKSDIDLVISTDVTGLKFYGIVERLRNRLNKKIDLIDIKQLCNNQELLNNVLMEGIRIYVQNK